MSADPATYAAEAALKAGPGPVEGSFVEIGGEPFYRVVNYDSMPPFLMSLVSASDHWFFISSNGALTAGRRDPDHSLFPYYTDDRIHDSQDQTGSKTVIRVDGKGGARLWEPFSPRYSGLYRLTRSLFKSVYGNKIVFEEVNHDLSLSFSYAWMTSERFGFVRRASLENRGSWRAEVAVLDGIQNVMPYGLTRRFQNEYSTLADGYRESERQPGTSLCLFKLSSIPTDKAEPSEALKVTAVWSEGLPGARIALTHAQLDPFRRGRPVAEETEVRGRRGMYFLNAAFTLASAGRRDWHVVADVNQDAAGVKTLLGLLASGGLTAEVEEDVARGTEDLVRIVAGVDGLQLTEDRLHTWRHFSNALFNAMRGGVPDSGYLISRSDLASFIGKTNRRVAKRQAAFLDSLPQTIPHAELLAQAREAGDPDLERLTHEYLPLTFSRRHGDPSRPWNAFVIDVKDDHGRKILNYQGNWRDIFQNWEALALSYPGYIESMIFKFADASTADGYNPYRITREGFDWEVINPHDVWSFIGYWGDHQVIYLLKLLEESRRYHPDALGRLLSARVFTYANVPYRIKPYEALLEQPRDTIEFDAALHGEARARGDVMGAEGKTLLDARGTPYRVNLAEKLLVLALTKLTNYIPEAGIWMNTQRPEWNDANNALVGNGVSMVTLYYLRRFLAFCRELFRLTETVPQVSVEVAGLLRRVTRALCENLRLLSGPVSDADRKQVLDLLGGAGSRYRSRLYKRGFSGRRAAVSAAELSSFWDAALAHIDHCIRANRRPDGLYHSYNLMKVEGGDRIAIRRLNEMLEGQVAVLCSGALSAEQCASLLDSLRKSGLYRADQNSYMLYPDRRLPKFLEKNTIPQEEVFASKLLRELQRRGDGSIVIRDLEGVCHFNAFRNAEALKEALASLKTGELRPLVEEEEPRILGLYERVFDHQSFTGRSGTFYKYEGLGSIYWHMVSKLALAVQEALARALETGAEQAPGRGLPPRSARLPSEGSTPALVERLRRHYREIRGGIGAHKPPDLYGAIPLDPYSHTPGFAGAQQPGMTGQVKEDLIARFAEMGLAVQKGRLTFRPRMAALEELLSTPREFLYYDVEGRRQSIRLESGTLAFTVCQVPVVVHGRGGPRVEITVTDGSTTVVEGLDLDADTSAAIFERKRKVARLDAFFGT